MGRRQRIRARERARRSEMADIEAHDASERLEERTFGTRARDAADNALFVIDTAGASSTTPNGAGARGFSEGPRKKGAALLAEPTRADEILAAPQRNPVAPLLKNAKTTYGARQGRKGRKRGAAGEEEGAVAAEIGVGAGARVVAGKRGAGSFVSEAARFAGTKHDPIENRDGNKRGRDKGSKYEDRAIPLRPSMNGGDFDLWGDEGDGGATAAASATAAVNGSGQGKKKKGARGAAPGAVVVPWGGGFVSAQGQNRGKRGSVAASVRGADRGSGYSDFAPGLSMQRVSERAGRKIPGRKNAVTSVPAVLVKSGGFSYNPSEQDHQEAMLEEAARLVERRERVRSQELKVKALRDRMVRGKSEKREMRARVEALKKKGIRSKKGDIVIVGDLDLEGHNVRPEDVPGGEGNAFLALRALGEHSSSSEDEDEDEGEGESGGGGSGDSDAGDSDDSGDDSGPAKKITRGADGRKLTRSERNKIAQRKERERREAEERKVRRIHQDAERVGTFVRDAKRAKTQSIETSRRNEEKRNLMLTLPNKNLAKKAQIERNATVDVLLPDELPGNLRRLATSGNLLHDRFVSFQERNFIEPRKKIGKKRKRSHNKKVYTPGEKGKKAEELHEARQKRLAEGRRKRKAQAV